MLRDSDHNKLCVRRFYTIGAGGGSAAVAHFRNSKIGFVNWLAFEFQSKRILSNSD